MIKVAAIGVAAAILAAWIKSVKSEYGIWILLAAGMIMGMCCLGKVETMVLELQFLQSYFSDYGSYIKLLLKVLGITYLSEISANLCKDAGAATMASQIELFGKLSILVLCMPIVTSLIQTIDHFLGG
jgi:stage III sporulation protein AD